MMLLEVRSMAKDKANKGSKKRHNDARFELRVKQEWLDRIEVQAERLGMNASSYIRNAATRQLEQDEASHPVPKPS
jgi:predicted DNA binding CopG/RHH family protein